MNKNYIIIGDSITYGIGDSENGGWASLFKKHILNKDDDYVCTNFVQIAGYPGATSEDILRKYDSILDALKYDYFDNIVILFIGVNDTQYFNGDYKASAQDYKENIQAIIKKTLDRGYKLIIMGISKIEIDGSIYNSLNTEEYEKDLKLILEYNNELENLTKEYQIDFIPTYDILEKDDFVDGLHPNSKGHEKIYLNVLDHLNK